MFKNNLYYEFKILLRSNWLLVLLITIGLLIAFAFNNGKKNVEKRLQDISTMKAELHKSDSVMISTLEKIEKKEAIDVPYWQLPSEPMTIGDRHPRLTIMQPDALSFLATGQSDMYTHFKSPTVYGNNFALDYSEMVNPVQLLFGNFDLAYVIIYILPLLIIAFTYNVLSKEKELGTLQLLSAQPIAVKTWLLQKMAIRYVLFTLIFGGIMLLIIAIFSLNIFDNLSKLFNLMLLVAGYILFWFTVSYIINIKINNSSKNALTLIGVWLIIVMVLPATVNQIASSLYPTPSRLNMINEIRLIKKENEKKQDEIMSSYLRDHPELSQENNGETFGFWHKYFASEKVMEDKTKPLLTAYETQLQKQQDLIGLFKYVSPAILMQQSLNTIAGTSEKHYNDYKKQVFEFSGTWRNYLVPMLFNGQKFTIKDYEQMPKFNYKNRVPNHLLSHVIIMFSVVLLIFIVFTRKKTLLLDK